MVDLFGQGFDLRTSAPKRVGSSMFHHFPAIGRYQQTPSSHLSRRALFLLAFSAVPLQGFLRVHDAACEKQMLVEKTVEHSSRLLPDLHDLV